MIKKAFILSGGVGERLKPLTENTAKTLLPVQGNPKIWYNIELAKRYGTKEIILGLGIKVEQFKEYFKDGYGFGVKVDYSIEKERLGTAGALKLAQDKIGNETFIMMNGDELKDINLKEMYEFHKKNNALATLALTEGDVVKSGCVKLDGDKISYFIEKPELEEAPSKLISAGLYILEPEIFDYIPDGKNFSIEKEVWPVLAKQGKLFGFEFKGQFLQTDTLEKYKKADEEWNGFKEPVD